MKTVAIIAEYNPFHLGHKYHIEEAKRLSGAKRALVVMSGSFVQRGEPACADKFIRAQWAADNGADIVIELPDVLSLSCAERFASAGVKIIKGTGLADCICFGSETADIDRLIAAASSKPDESAFDEAISAGLSYPAALSCATGNKLGPNDILGIEYLRTINSFAPDIKAFAVKRSGGGYADDELGEGFSSAIAIRNAIAASGTRMSPSVFDALVKALPRDELDQIAQLKKKGTFPAALNDLSDLLLYKFRSMSADDIALLPNVSEGLENLFIKHANDSCDASEMLAKVKSKRYTMARLKRIAMCALLGITEEIQKGAIENESALYARVLAIKSSSAEMLSELREKSTIPVIVRSSDRDMLPPEARKIERISAAAHKIRALGQPYDKCVEVDESHRLIVR